MGWLNAFITANVVGIGSNFDNCGAGIGYGSDRVRFPHRINLIVNGVGGLTAMLGAYGGRFISHYLTLQEAALAACVVLVSIGVFFMYSAYIHPLICRQSKQLRMKTPGWKQGITLGFALSFTNIASGFGATVSHASTIWATTLAIMIWGYIMIWIGNVIGIGLIARILGKYASLVAGLLLVFVGLHQVI